MATPQPGILAPAPTFSRSLIFDLAPGADPRAALGRLASRPIGLELVVGLGASLVARMDGTVPGLREIPPLTGPGIAIPSTPRSLWLWLRAEAPGAFLPRARALVAELEGVFTLADTIDGFQYDGGRDLTGYVDGTENPTGDAAAQAAIVRGGPGLDGSSFVAVQWWKHELGRFHAMAPADRDLVVGRRAEDDVEIEDAPATAHVKRTEQESFEPAAFIVRRSMPWADARGEGLLFIAFGRSLDAFEAQLRRMVGLEDGIPDALFRFTRPLTGSTFFCPPRAEDGHGLDLSRLGIPG